MDQRLIPEASSLRQLASTLRIGSAVRNYDLIVANEYSTAIGLGLLARFFRSRARMVVVGLNLSRRAFKTRIGPLQRIIDKALGRYDAIVVHSPAEVTSFVDLHQLDRSRFRVIPWGFDLPTYDSATVTNLPARYVCVIGRNNRDFETAAEGLKGTGVAAVFVGAATAFETAEPEIRCFQSLPFEDCLKIMSSALANVILVKDSARGAGHITAVAGMLLAKPHIFSDVETLSGYLEDGRDGIAIPLGDAAAFNRAVIRLAADRALATKMGNAARDHALREMSNDKFMERIVEVMVGPQT
ncbi:MAG: glycosyltransferase family 4 protein [Sphingomonas sp.]|nr:glycosyltransferase family 4 protein [Sphingomonas sp.]